MAVPKSAIDPLTGVRFGEDSRTYQDILTPAAVAFVADLHRRFDGRRLALLAERVARQQRYDGGELPDFRADTVAIREGDWTVARIPDALMDRRVEITGPVERKMIINALNSGAKVFMADFEDSSAPTWARSTSWSPTSSCPAWAAASSPTSSRPAARSSRSST